MSGHLFDPPPATLTGRQLRALEVLRAAGPDGLTGEQLGDALGIPKVYAHATGLEVLRALKKKGHVRQRRNGLWTAIEPRRSGDTGFPEGY